MARPLRADKLISIIIPDRHRNRVTTAFLGAFPIPRFPEGHPQQGDLEFTSEEWVAERGVIFIRDTVASYEQNQGRLLVKYLPIDDIARRG